MCLPAVVVAIYIDHTSRGNRWPYFSSTATSIDVRMSWLGYTPEQPRSCTRVALLWSQIWLLCNRCVHRSRPTAAAATRPTPMLTSTPKRTADQCRAASGRAGSNSPMVAVVERVGV